MGTQATTWTGDGGWGNEPPEKLRIAANNVLTRRTV
jgi:hypothetical protein